MPILVFQPALANWMHSISEDYVIAAQLRLDGANREYDQATHCFYAAQALYLDLLSDQTRASQEADSADHSVQYEEAPREVKAYFMEHLRIHMPILSEHGCGVRQDCLDMVISFLCCRCPPITWDTLTQIISFFLQYLDEVLTRLEACKEQAGDHRDHLARESVQLRRETQRVRQTCRWFLHDQAA